MQKCMKQNLSTLQPINFTYCLLYRGISDFIKQRLHQVIFLIRKQFLILTTFLKIKNKQPAFCFFNNLYDSCGIHQLSNDNILGDGISLSHQRRFQSMAANEETTHYVFSGLW